MRVKNMILHTIYSLCKKRQKNDGKKMINLGTDCVTSVRFFKQITDFLV